MDEPMAFILSNLPGLVALVIAFMLGTAVEQYRVKARRAEWRAKNGWKFRKKKPVTRADFAAGQLKTVSQAPFTSRPLLNKSEANVFTALDKAVIARNPGWQVMAQVSLGEFLASPDKNAFLSVNSKRVGAYDRGRAAGAGGEVGAGGLREQRKKVHCHRNAGKTALPV